MTKPTGLLVATACVAGLWLSGCSAGSPDHRALLELSNDFFDAMERRDVELAERLVVPEGVYVSVRPGSNGREIRSFSNAEWLAELADEEQIVQERFTESPFVLVEGDVAMLWSAYALDLDGEPSHTGIDVFTFVRTNDGWRIAGGVYSVVPVE